MIFPAKRFLRIEISVKYPLQDWTRMVSFVILLPHILLAGLMAPFVLALLWFAFRRQFDRHRKLARWVWPVWVYVSISGVAVYLMLYQYAIPRTTPEIQPPRSPAVQSAD